MYIRVPTIIQLLIYKSIHIDNTNVPPSIIHKLIYENPKFLIPQYNNSSRKLDNIHDTYENK